MNDLAILTQSRPWESLIDMVCRTVTSEHSKKAYRNALRDFFTWFESEPVLESKPVIRDTSINRATILLYKEHLDHTGLSPSTISLRLTVIRQLCKEAKLAGAIDQSAWEGIQAISGPRREGRRTGNWLTAEQAAKLIQAPPADTLRGKRDRAILGTLIGCGIRRAELCTLRREQIQQRDGRWVIVDIAGKRQRVRSVPMPGWTKALIDGWWAEMLMTPWSEPLYVEHTKADEYAFVSLGKGNGFPQHRDIQHISRNAVFELVQFWSEKAGHRVAPHDLRRTFSKLALRGKADLHQIQLTLGHASILTTERYLGTEQDLGNAPCDVLGIDLSKERDI